MRSTIAEIEEKPNPWCVSCKRMMGKCGTVKGVRMWRCLECGSCVKSYYCAARGPGFNFKRHPADNNPWCLACRKPTVRHSRRAGEGWNSEWECKRCDFRISMRTQSKRQRRLQNAERMGTLHSNPWCLSCRVPMKSTGKGGRVWRCTQCMISTVKVAIMPKKPDLPRPCCLTCRNPLAFSGKGKWRCHRCDFVVAMEHSRSRTAKYKPDHPWCIVCHRQMKQSGVAGNKKWECKTCRFSCTQHVTRASRLPNVDQRIESLIPRNWSLDLRERVKAQLVAELRAGKITLRDVTSLKVRRVVHGVTRQRPRRCFSSFDSQLRIRARRTG